MKNNKKIGLLALILPLVPILALFLLGLTLALGAAGTAAGAVPAGDAGAVDLIAVCDWLSQEPDREPAGAVQVQLMRDGSPCGDPVDLDAAHDWEYYWRGLDGGHSYSVELVSELPDRYVFRPEAAYGEYVSESRHKYVVCSMIAADDTCDASLPWDCPMSVHEVWFCDPGSRPAHVTRALRFDGGDSSPMDAVSLGELNGWRYLFSCSGAYDRQFGDRMTDDEWRALVAGRLAERGIPVPAGDGHADGVDGNPDEGYQTVVVEHFWERRDAGGVQSACVIANVPA